MLSFSLAKHNQAMASCRGWSETSDLGCCQGTADSCKSWLPERAGQRGLPAATARQVHRTPISARTFKNCIWYLCMV